MADLDQNQQATPYKLQEARKKGQVARSADAVSAVTFSCAMIFLSTQGWETWRRQLLFDQALLMQIGRLDGSPAALWTLLQQMLHATLELAMPFFVMLVIAAVLGNLLQTGVVLSLDPLKPDVERINPVAGMKRLFSMRTLFSALRAILKMLLLGAVSYYALRNMVPQFYYLAALPARLQMQTLLADLGALGMKTAAMLALVALIDLIYTRRDFARRMRMSSREIKDENKQRNGDPRIRSRLRELRREVVKRSLAFRNTKNADVLITNPTHIAVALRYDHGKMVSPQLIAKGAGFQAAAMRAIAARYSIPVVQNPPLARKLYKELTLERHVPQSMYADVARIIVWVFAMRKRRQQATSEQVAAQAHSAIIGEAQ
ncbi:EscU/YscU/HrcU family type III secretion system export apparatus switch protein [Herbaspirillum rubrisubalbicans]|uniref:EscU/YscU/HrcU family type III secretion system export apparatus switch protein n=1 Tax=Herbaspirillum rubrisubalbicans TaxID=80842 RepID=UPI000DD41621|nr:EscU/YscU/HrcU family type III secretion system export apparatus switch protein [Herbaspirillum rubrisubalbicans]